ncbi:ribosome biogenesis GTP-binding protein YihA/YsxC [Acidaminobacterium chupaoyuni]
MRLNQATFVRSAAQVSDFPRDALPRIIFAGRSNVGKSSTINNIVQRKNFARVSSMPGKTVFVNLFRIDEEAWFVDLPGYGYAKVSQKEKDRFSQLIEAYMAEDRDEIAKAYLIVDLRHQPTRDDQMMLEWFRAYGVPVTVVANKADKLKKSEIETQMTLCRQTLALRPDELCIAYSAEKGTGREELARDILEAVQQYERRNQ